MPKKALITGITGMVGSHLADYLLDNTDWDIYGMCRWRSPLDNVQHLLPRVNAKDRVYFLDGDLTDYVSLVNVVEQSKPDYVFHLAAQSYPATSFTAPLQTLDTNILGTERLLEALRHHPTVDPVIHVCSSSEVFGRVPKEKLPIGEECSFHPASPYSISKIGTDLIGRFHAEAYGQKCLTTRMFTHTGPRRGDVFAESSFAKQIAMIEAGMLPPVVKTGNLQSLRTWADVRDAVRAYYLLVTTNPVAGEYYNIGGSYSCTVEDMLNYLISRSTVSEIKVEQEASRVRPLDADLQLPDTQKFQTHTGWKPQISFEQTMNDLLDYWRAKVRAKENFLQR
ncbi:GDP-mannose 4,6-dehydratase [Thalassotalea euphylliae]|uniref:GDP-mannose 4,6 dehydratase n=1 Tax=Thalassotalea euphylliae TaxID=1655234 RepID=A0A3E0UD48_9GAMM|nr:GDP-mannose 4,6-dehydratase [Thalassotalea euphylliae]REL34826.1 GDP-mannose 4,6 dehydratase [Thalassotalea euphylliae]